MEELVRSITRMTNTSIVAEYRLESYDLFLAGPDSFIYRLAFLFVTARRYPHLEIVCYNLTMTDELTKYEYLNYCRYVIDKDLWRSPPPFLR